jgi:hypothetical protein
MKKSSKREVGSLLTKSQLKVMLICLGSTLLFIYALAWFYSVNEPRQVGGYGINLQLSEWTIIVYSFCLIVLSMAASFVFLTLGAVMFLVSLRKPGLRKRALIFLAIGLSSLVVKVYLLPLII